MFLMDVEKYLVKNNILVNKQYFIEINLLEHYEGKRKILVFKDFLPKTYSKYHPNKDR